jgi:hypothetical protein
LLHVDLEMPGVSSMLRRTDSAPCLTENRPVTIIVAQMDAHGFALCDILEGARLANGELSYVDAMFRRAAMSERNG